MKGARTCKKFFKLLLQLIKVLAVTLQLVTFSGERATFLSFLDANTISFHHVFMKDWNQDYEQQPSTPTGDYALYSQQEVIDHVYHVLKSYNFYSEISLTGYTYNRTVVPLTLCTSYYKEINLDPLKESFTVNHERDVLDANGELHARRTSTILNQSVELEVIVRQGSEVRDTEVEELRKRLKNLFQTPCKKFKKDKKFPFKLLLQLIKVLAVTLQLVTFSGERTTFQSFLDTNKISFHHVFMKEWSKDYEQLPYPPTGDYALYSQQEVIDHVYHVLKSYNFYSEISLTGYTYNRTVVPLTLCTSYYKEINLDPLKESFTVNHERDVECTRVLGPGGANFTNCKLEDEDCNGIKGHLWGVIDFNRLYWMNVTLELRGIYVKKQDYSLEQPVDDVECVQYIVRIDYDNKNRNGKIVVTLDVALDMKECDGSTTKVDEAAVINLQSSQIALTVFDGFIIVLCILSLGLTIRSVVKRSRLLKTTKKLFKERYNYILTIPERLLFLSSWFVQVIVSDLMVIAGCILKISIRFGSVATDETFNNNSYFDAAGIMLGIANLFEWIGLLRFLSFFPRYYVLILTISNALPALIRFVVCAGTVLAGYVFAGWIVLGPHHPKFQTFGQTIECLFSLINGDEIYTTFSIINLTNNSTAIWLFSRFYFYSFIFLSVFAIFNLFIAVIMDSYETVKNWYQDGFPTTFLEKFSNGKVKEILANSGSNVRAQNFDGRLDADDIDASYGWLSPFVCCLDHCVRHDVNSQQHERESDIELNNIIVTEHED